MEKKYSSFISEHTAEYVLIPKLIHIMKKKFYNVTPIYPWLSREGNNISKIIHEQDKFKIFGLFPRRPKINLTDNKIMLKINAEILEAAKEASDNYIPMLAGCPVVKSFWDLNEDTRCIWIKLNNKTRYLYEIQYNKENMFVNNIKDNVEVLASDDDILNFITEKSKLLDIKSLIIAIRKIKSRSSITSYMNIGNYKPIYFLLK